MSNEDIGKYRNRSKLGELPQDIDGFGKSKARISGSLDRIQAKIDGMRENFADDYPNALIHSANSIINDLTEIIDNASAWQTLIHITQGVIKDPLSRRLKEHKDL